MVRCSSAANFESPIPLSEKLNGRERTHGQTESLACDRIPELCELQLDRSEDCDGQRVTWTDLGKGL
jgi:hypothetical protein